MDFINNIIQWLEANWGVTVFGSLSIGGIITNTIFLVKTWLGNKAQGTKYEEWFNVATKTTGTIKEIYEAEKAEKEKVQAENILLKAAQMVTMDAILKMVMSSKMDPDDKISIVSNVEKLKQLEPKELKENIVTKTKEKTTEVINTATANLQENPAETVVNITAGVSSLLQKYTPEKEKKG